VELVLPEEPLKAELLAMTSLPRRGHHSAPDEGYLRPFFNLSAGFNRAGQSSGWSCDLRALFKRLMPVVTNALLRAILALEGGYQCGNQYL
jgi:hypothetical protein